MDEAELIGAAQGGDRAAFDELVRRTYVDTFTLALRLTGNEEDARDVVQDAYLRAWKGIGRFRGDAQFSTWMYRITANAASTHVRKRRRHRTEPLDDDVRAVETRGRKSQPAPAGRVGRRRSSGIAPRVDELPPKLRSRRGAEGRLRPVRTRRSPRSSASPSPRRRSGCTGPGGSCATLLYEEGAELMRCDDVAALLPELVDGGRRDESRCRAPRRVVPALPGGAGPLPASSCATWSCSGPATSSRRRACSPRRSRRSTDAAERQRVPHAGHGPPLAYAGAIGGDRGAATAATALIIARSRRRGASAWPAEARAPAVPAGGRGPLLSWRPGPAPGGQ